MSSSDSSGLKIFGAGEWLHEKHGGKPRRSWRRLHLAVDPDSSDILAAELTDEGDASLVGPLLDQIEGLVSAVLADGAYDGDPTYRTVLERHPDAEVVIPPRSNAVLSDAAETEPTQRDQHIQLLAKKGRMGWQKAVGYGKRSLVETAFYRYKILIGRRLRSVRAEGRGPHRLQGDQPHDQPRHASVPEGRLNTGTEGELCPQRHLCTKARCR